MKRLNPTRWLAVLTCLVGCVGGCVAPQVLLAQYEYRVGKGQASIEPDQQILSLALAGYGAPREGRFSLEWMAYGQLGEVDDAAAVADQLYVLREGDVWRTDLSDLKQAATRLTQSEDIRILAGGAGRLFAVNAENQLMEAKVSRKGAVRWRHRGALQQTAKSLAYWKDRWVLLDTEGTLWTATDRRGTLMWEPLTSRADVIDVIGTSDQLFILTADQEILRYGSPTGWLRVAIHNGITYHQDLKCVVSSDQGFWALDRAGALYRAQHNTDRQLAVNAVVIQKGKDRVALLGLDVCGFDTNFVNIVKQEIYRKYGIAPNAVMVNASHTHFAPVTQPWLTWGPHCQRPDSTYLFTVVKSGMMAAVQQATQELKPANLYLGKSEADVGHNRNLPGDNLPYDKTLDVLRIDYEDTEKDDIIFLVGCHPVFQNAGREGVTVSANYPGVAREMLLHHPKVRSAMFLQGCGGDINPVDADHRITAKKVVSAVTDLLDGDAMQSITGGITTYMDTVKFDSRPWSADKIREFRKANEGKEGDVGAEKNVRWADLMLQYIQDGDMPKTMPVFVQTINIGNWKLVGISRETTTEYGLGVKALWPNQLVTVAGYCNDVSSYLPTRRHINAKVYEGYDSFYWYGQPNVFPENVYETIISAIKSNNR